jgi:nucleoside-diphosphate-sugar epimerase
MNVLVTGAFGMVGRSTLEALLFKGYTVRVFDINTPQNRKYAQNYTDNPHVEIVWGDLRELPDIMRACEGVAVVIHLAAIIPPLADKNHALARVVNIGGTENVVTAVKAQVEPPRLIYTSSISVYGDRVDNPLIKVTDPVNPSHDEYAKTKLAAENLIRGSGVEYAIFRLTYIVSPEKIEMDPLMFHMPLKTSIEVCHVKDVGVALANAVENQQIWGNIFHIAGGEKCRTTYKEYINCMMDIFGLGSRLLPDEAFSTGKFHCGFMDTTESEALLHYQQYTLKDYYKEVKERVQYKRWLFIIFRWVVKQYLLRKSEFYKNCKKGK